MMSVSYAAPGGPLVWLTLWLAVAGLGLVAAARLSPGGNRGGRGVLWWVVATPLALIAAAIILVLVNVVIAVLTVS
ncbi:hypothetical protein Tmar_1949 [Thermaerobacter marianensis DSM 12885]|uniref:Uncharacterized protein n=2 Tax=Thermaerobacter marianensis TaxID=73919 RepID=E6SIT8_THEM7|nr:hypothetical protein Tmar_1949 [Thermaerobacter marianensis DSM 12885]